MRSVTIPSGSPGSADQSLELLGVLRDQSTNEEARCEAFEKLLSLSSGWWHHARPCSLLEYACAFALFRARTVAGREVADRLDWEGVANQAVIVLYTSAARIKGDPAAWFRGVIKRLISQEARVNWPLLTAYPVDETFVAPSAGEDGSRTEVNEIFGEDPVRAAIRELSPKLQVVAELLLIERCSREEVCRMLDLKPELLRKRFERISQHVSRVLEVRAS